MYYGTIDTKTTKHLICHICSFFTSEINATYLLMGTCATETDFGNHKDTSEFRHGSGLMQIDRIAFEDTKKRTSTILKAMIKNSFWIDLDLCTYEMLEYNAFLSVLFARLFYMLIPEKIPDTMDLQATYWKTYYNTRKGKGTIEDYITKSKKYI